MSVKTKLATAAGIVGILVVGAVVKVGTREATSAGIDAYNRHEAVDEIDKLDTEGPMAAFLQELRRVEPARYEAFKSEMKATILNASSPMDAKTRMMDFGRETMATYRAAAPKASEEKMRDLAETRLAMLKVVQNQSAADCGRLAVSGPWPGMESSPAVMEAIGKAAASLVRAGAEGMDSPVTYPEPNEAEYAELGNKLSTSGMTEAQMNALGSNEIKSLSPEDQCFVVIKVFEQGLSMHSPSILSMLLKE